MKKVTIALAGLLTLGFASCLKDHVNPNITGADSPNGVAFVRSVSGISYGVYSVPRPDTMSMVVVSLEGTSTPTSRVTANVVVDTAAARAAGLTPLPLSMIRYISPSAIFEAGQRLDTLTVILGDRSTLNPNKTYGLGLRLTSADGGYQVARNLNTIVITIAVKNKYDGVYRLRGYHNRSPYNFPYDTEMELRTATSNSVDFWWPEVGNFGHPIGTGPGQMSWYGATMAPRIIFNTTTDKVIDVVNTSPGGTAVTMFTGAGAGISRYDSATRTIYVYWNYGGNPQRAFFDTLTFLHPR